MRWSARRSRYSPTVGGATDGGKLKLVPFVPGTGTECESRIGFHGRHPAGKSFRFLLGRQDHRVAALNDDGGLAFIAGQFFLGIADN